MGHRRRKKKIKATKLKKFNYYVRHGMDRAGFVNNHHLTPGGSDSNYNILKIDALRHVCWHKLFGLLTIEQVIALLQRTVKMKGR